MCNRLRISGVGIFDIIHYDGGKNLLQHQFEDLFSLGKLILCLACKVIISFFFGFCLWEKSVLVGSEFGCGFNGRWILFDLIVFCSLDGFNFSILESFSGSNDSKIP